MWEVRCEDTLFIISKLHGSLLLDLFEFRSEYYESQSFSPKRDATGLREGLVRVVV